MEEDNGACDSAVELTFTAVEIDLDYEFEAARFFDFTREESVVEAREAEMWFHSVGSYPPSPFAMKLLSRGDIENANASIESKGFGDTNQLESETRQAPEDSAMDLSSTDGDGTDRGAFLDLKSCFVQGFQSQQPTNTIHRGLTTKDSTRNDGYKPKAKASWKPSFPRTSTLLKPTASQLAKQNQELIMNLSRFQKPENNNPSGVESQAAKRQKLERGHLCKVTDTMQQANFVHKAPKREVTANGNAAHGRLRITIPRPPDLATANRARRIRPKADSACEHVASRTTGFRALPLNRKIFEVPSSLHQKRSIPQLPEFQEFHLKTSERAVQNAAAVPSTSSACCNSFKAQQRPSFAFVAEGSNREPNRPHVSTDAPKQEDCETMHRFKALPLNKKIFSSKGDIGVFRNSKREATVTTPFNFRTEKRAQHAPPIDLFNKLSLEPEQHESGSRLNLSRPPSVFAKGSKENRACTFQQQSEVKQFPTEKRPETGPKQVHSECDKRVTRGAPFSRIGRGLGIR